MNDEAYEKAVLERKEWETGSLGKSQEFLIFLNENPQKEKVLDSALKVESSSISYVMKDSFIERISKRNITPIEIGECFNNLKKQFAADSRENGVESQTLWFIGKTKKSRNLKVILVKYKNQYILINAYEPSDQEYVMYSQAPAKNKKSKKTIKLNFLLFSIEFSIGEDK